MGRFLSADDIDVVLTLQSDSPNGLNLYAYCLNNPVMLTDPSGKLAGAIIGAVLAFSAFMGIAAGLANAEIQNRDLGYGALTGLVGGFLNGTLGIFSVVLNPMIGIIGGPLVGAFTEWMSQKLNNEDTNIGSIIYSAFSYGIANLIGASLGLLKDAISEIAMSFIITPVVFSIQTFVDNLMSVFKQKENKDNIAFGGGGGRSW